jgi:hypothetical protein
VRAVLARSHISRQHHKDERIERGFDESVVQILAGSISSVWQMVGLHGVIVEHMSRSAPTHRQVGLVDTPIGGNLANRGMGPATTTGTGPAPGPSNAASPAVASPTATSLSGDDDRAWCVPSDVIGD